LPGEVELQEGIIKLAARIIDYINKLVFPPKCIFCSELLEYKEKLEICTKCIGKVPLIKDNSVFLKSFMHGVDAEAVWFDGIFCTCEYKGIVKEAIIRYKYFGKYSYYRAFANLTAQRLKAVKNMDEFDMVISVPLHKRKERTRGYNQSLLISRALGKITGIPDKSRLLARIRHTDTQSLLHRNERYINVKDAFTVTDENEVEGKSILLVDDVLTTGYTLNECSKVLKKAGARQVYAVVVAAALHDIAQL